jgi:hypothetical protein
MHNLHLVVVKADCPEDACNHVENELMDWGNENNWRTICGCVSEHDEVYVNDDGRWSPADQEYNTIKKLNKLVKSWINDSGIYCESAIEMLKTEPDITKWPKHELWSLQQYAKYLYQVADIERENVDIFKTTLFNYDFDEMGVTDMMEDDDGETRYVVFVDMHS